MFVRKMLDYNDHKESEIPQEKSFSLIHRCQLRFKVDDDNSEDEEPDDEEDASDDTNDADPLLA